MFSHDENPDEDRDTPAPGEPAMPAQAGLPGANAAEGQLVLPDAAMSDAQKRAEAEGLEQPVTPKKARIGEQQPVTPIDDDAMVDCATALAPFSTKGVNLTCKVNLNKPRCGTACAVVCGGVKKKEKQLAICWNPFCLEPCLTAELHFARFVRSPSLVCVCYIDCTWHAYVLCM